MDHVIAQVELAHVMGVGVATLPVERIARMRVRTVGHATNMMGSAYVQMRVSLGHSARFRSNALTAGRAIL